MPKVPEGGGQSLEGSREKSTGEAFSTESLVCSEELERLCPAPTPGDPKTKGAQAGWGGAGATQGSQVFEITEGE